MTQFTEIPLRNVWKEHILAAVNWTDLINNSSFKNKLWYAGICLDLFVGGSIRHYSRDNCFECEKCIFVESEMCPACEIHLGIIEAFLQGIMNKYSSVTRSIKDKRCIIIL